LKVTREKIENSQAYLTVEMEPAEMEVGMQGSYRRLSQKANIPGFRRGKAPRNVVERYLGRARLVEEAIDHMLPQAYEQALKQENIEAYAQPEMEITQTDPLIFKAIVPLAPTVELGDYRSIRLTQEQVDIKDENIDAVLQELRHQHATWEPVDRPLDYNDMAVIDINGEVGDTPFVKRAAAQYQLVKDSISPAPGFVDQIIGMKKEEEKEFKLTFPEDYPSKELAGKEASFKVKLHEIKEEKLPEINDEFATQVGTELKNVADLREEVKKGLTLRAEERARMDFEEKIINDAVERSKVEYPPVLVNMEINRILNDQARQLQMAGHAVDEYLKSIGKTAEQLQEELRPVAVRNVTASLVLSKIAETEKIEVTEEDIANGINNLSRGLADDKKEDMRKLLDTTKRRDSIKQSLLTRKTIERLSGIARNTEEPAKETKEEKNEQPTVAESTD
jgi:trigger factor